MFPFPLSLASYCTMGFSSSSSSPDLSWRESGGDFCIWATIFALFVGLIWQLKTFFFPNRSRGSSLAPDPHQVISLASSVNQTQIKPLLRIPKIVSDGDLEGLINNLDDGKDTWENVIDKRNNLFSYTAKCCKPKGDPLRYMSITIFEDCSTEKLRDFYMDNSYRQQWDKTIVDHQQLEVDESNGTEIGRTVKKFPFLSPREYILAWRLWEGEDETFYCFIKECEHPLAPRQKKYIRVKLFRSGWRIRKVPGRSACEIKMLHQEDAGLNVEMAKMAFAKGIWSYVCKMDDALRKYPGFHSSQTSSAVTLIQKVPQGINPPLGYKASSDAAITESEDGVSGIAGSGQPKERELTGRPSKKVIANGLLVLGGLVCLSRGHSSLGAKLAMAYILTKLTKRNES